MSHPFSARQIQSRISLNLHSVKLRLRNTTTLSRNNSYREVAVEVDPVRSSSLSSPTHRDPLGEVRHCDARQWVRRGKPRCPRHSFILEDSPASPRIDLGLPPLVVWIRVLEAL